ncbi:DNA methyltransferase [Erysipelatoclostridium ramosum]|uniref:DNA methyltransferase n=1 Tax=Thomasclavelia ramosa TaxID=1547 RepID=UPI001E3D6809|nr:DNA methyltransferase [Thomasclavelia ramosa]MDB7095837.1 DNA methyltransferase [Thomasclavelia ramosa]
MKYFAKVPWTKGNSVANTGRKSKNTEDVMIFSKGKPRSLKLNAKKNIQTALNNGLDIKGMDSSQVKALLEENNLVVHYMSGTSSMLPTQFNYQPKSITKRVYQTEKPVELLEEIISYISLPYEVILDQFARSGNLAVAALNMSRNAIVIEGVENIQNTSQEKRNLAKENFNLMKKI